MCQSKFAYNPYPTTFSLDNIPNKMKNTGVIVLTVYLENLLL